ncbi:MAG: Rrf2 family transcriptional regulator [Eubacterium sp.]|nr:Rrf2 family transcriptional regulator [Eubacterium sp.]
MISTRGRYALRVMIDLTEHEEGARIPLKEIAERQGISKKYLEIIMKDMVTAGLVKSASGKNGGYSLSRRPEEYTVFEILETMEGTLSPVACLADCSYECNRKESCKTLPMWTDFDKTIRDFFGSRTLADFTLS